MKIKLSLIILLLLINKIFFSEEMPFKKIKDIEEVEKQNRKTAEYKGKLFIGGDYVETTFEDDLGVYILNKYNNELYYNLYNDLCIIEYDLDTHNGNLIKAAPKSVMIGISEDGKYLYHFGIGAPFVYDISRILLDDKKNERVIHTASGFPRDLATRLYYIKYVKDTKFIFTVAINKDVDFSPDIIEEGRKVTKKDSYYPIPEISREPLPCEIYEIEVKGPIPVKDNDKSAFTLNKFKLDLSDYGVKGELQENSPFKVHQLIDYSRSMKKYAFIGRVYKSKDRKNFIDYLFLVDEKGGKPEPVIELNKGSDIQDMIFSPEGDKLVLDINKYIYLYILNFK